MKKISIIAYALWVLGVVVLKIVGIANWWVVFSPIWLPLGVFLSITLAIVVLSWLGDRAKAREPETCANCLWAKSAGLNPDDRCLGETLDDSNARPKKCKYYRKFKG